jgi:hypothetical protein
MLLVEAQRPRAEIMSQPYDGQRSIHVVGETWFTSPIVPGTARVSPGSSS